ncbi:MAG TPA: hypothetical protein VHD63_13705 [Ktedonobacteraceae bacterium]|nr:hypothetical protein [Ktedonobacteraceae bacterium]
MLERDKQRSDQPKKQEREKKLHEQSEQEQKAPSRTEQRQAEMATDPAAARDEGYIKRMNEKTQKH